MIAILDWHQCTKAPKVSARAPCAACHETGCFMVEIEVMAVSAAD